MRPIGKHHVDLKRTAVTVPTSDEMRHLAGPIADHAVVAVLETGATIADLEAALIYARGEGNYIDRLGHPLSGLNLRSLRCPGMETHHVGNLARQGCARHHQGQGV